MEPTSFEHFSTISPVSDTLNEDSHQACQVIIMDDDVVLISETSPEVFANTKPARHFITL